MFLHQQAPTPQLIPTRFIWRYGGSQVSESEVRGKDGQTNEWTDAATILPLALSGFLVRLVHAVGRHGSHADG